VSTTTALSNPTLIELAVEDIFEGIQRKVRNARIHMPKDGAPADWHVLDLHSTVLDDRRLLESGLQVRRKTGNSMGTLNTVLAVAARSALAGNRATWGRNEAFAGWSVEDLVQELYSTLAHNADAVEVLAEYDGSALKNKSRQLSLDKLKLERKKGFVLSLDTSYRAFELPAASLLPEPLSESDLQVQAALAELPEDIREAVTRYSANGENQQDIADDLGVDKGTVSRRASAGRAALKIRLSDLVEAPAPQCVSSNHRATPIDFPEWVKVLGPSR
jgi:DNA-directed RNA polymerase specialized sigma24 family protein